MPDEAPRRVREAARDASSRDDLVGEPYPMMWDGADMPYPLDEETLDEQASTQMGPWEPRRRDADDD